MAKKVSRKPKKFKVFEGVIEYDKEDGGQALIATIRDEVPPPPIDPALVGRDSGMFVRIQSWEDEDVTKDEDPEHRIARSIEGKVVRVTIEVL